LHAYRDAARRRRSLRLLEFEHKLVGWLIRRDLAVRYLDDRKLHVSKIAWLLGFNDVSAFTHTFKRWTGKTPSQMRTAST
jgi:AraC-like DNA-binding protein